MIESLKISYKDFDQLDNIYLEDSYVERIFLDRNLIEIYLLTVLCENHPLYHLPFKGEQYCYKNSKLTFPEVKMFKWENGIKKPIVGIEGESDFGNIDSFFLEGKTYKLQGDWGKLEIISNPPEIKFKK